MLENLDLCKYNQNDAVVVHQDSSTSGGVVVYCLYGSLCNSFITHAEGELSGSEKRPDRD